MAPPPYRPKAKRRPAKPSGGAGTILLIVGGLVVVGGVIAIVVANNSPKPVVKAPEPPPMGPSERFSAARQKALDAMNRARNCAATDFDGKRKGYTEAEQAFREAQEASKECRTSGITSAASADEQEREIRSFLVECHKSKPMGGK